MTKVRIKDDEGWVKPQIDEIYKDDVEELYVVREVFNKMCIVCPLVNTSYLACEIIEFATMLAEDWVRIGFEAHNNRLKDKE